MHVLDGSCYEGSWSESDLSSHPTAAYGADLEGYIHVWYRMKYTQTWLLYVRCAIWDSSFKCTSKWWQFVDVYRETNSMYVYYTRK